MLGVIVGLHLRLGRRPLPVRPALLVLEVVASPLVWPAAVVDQDRGLAGEVGVDTLDGEAVDAAGLGNVFGRLGRRGRVVAGNDALLWWASDLVGLGEARRLRPDLPRPLRQESPADVHAAGDGSGYQAVLGHLAPVDLA